MDSPDTIETVPVIGTFILTVGSILLLTGVLPGRDIKLFSIPGAGSVPLGALPAAFLATNLISALYEIGRHAQVLKGKVAQKVAKVNVNYQD